MITWGVELKNNSGYLYIFNLSTDLDNEILAFTHDWIEEFSLHFEKVVVYSTHIGAKRLPKNVFVQELGGGTAKHRVRAIVNLVCSLMHIMLDSKNRCVFYHMNARAASIIGLPLKILRIPQILWYSHAHSSFSLKIATHFVNRVVSTSNSSFPYSTGKLVSTGHGVRDENIIQTTEIHLPESISFIGRVSRVKRLEILINEVFIFQNLHKHQLKFFILGPCESDLDQKYKLELIALADKKNVKLIFVGSIPHKNVQFELSKYDMAYNGTLMSLDKGAIESVFAKSILVSDQTNILKECGYSNFSLDANGEALKISEQLERIFALSNQEKSTITENAKNEALARHSLSSTTAKIVNLFSTIKSSNEK